MPCFHLHGLEAAPLKSDAKPRMRWKFVVHSILATTQPMRTNQGFRFSTLQSTMSSILFNSSFINDFDTFDTEALCLHPQKLPHLVEKHIVVKLAAYHDTMYHHVGLLNLHIHNTHWIRSHAQNATRKAEITYLVLEQCYHTCGIARSFPIPTEFPSGTMCDM